MATQKSKAFYDHKRANHASEYGQNCPECASLWKEMLAESLGKKT